MWDNSKSLLLSRYLLYLALVLWQIPILFAIFGDISKAIFNTYLLNYIPIILILRAMLKFLNNIGRGNIFCTENVEYLRQVSWYCLFSGIFSLLGAVFEPILIICAGVVGFFGLLMRVIKNMLTEANMIKQENDYTI